MPIQFPDFGQISFDQANPFLVGAERGQKMTQSAIQFPQDMRAKMLANQIAAVQAKYAEPMTQADLLKEQLFNKFYPQDKQSEIGLRGAQATNLGAETRKTNYLLQHPGFMGGDETKSIEALRQMGLLNQNYQSNQQPQPTSGQPQPGQQPGSGQPNPAYAQAQDIAKAVVRQQQNMGIPANQTTPQTGLQLPSVNGSSNGIGPGSGFDVNNLVSALINKPMSDLQYKQTVTRVMQQNLAGKAYTSMPSVEKEYAIAQARSLGYTGEQASKLFNQGYDLASMAQMKGYDGANPNSWPMARGAPTTAIQTRIQRANSTLAALDAVQGPIASAYAKYAPRFANVSPGLIKDMISGEHPDDQADALAAYALYPEISALRINAMGGNVGEGAIEHIADAAFSRLNTLGISPNSLVYKKVQERVGKLIKQMNHAENSAIFKQTNDSFANDDAQTAGGAGNFDFTGKSDEELMKMVGDG